MCGICGVMHAGLAMQSLKLQIERMNAMIAHRGPDGEGIHIEGPIGIGHRRLSIIDQKYGSQPIIDNRGFSITYNGELYNFQDLRVELESVGEVFETKTDTEVVLKAYIRWGVECLKRFNGMFAFAIVNHHENELFLARDRIGIKPLYYALIPGGLAFSSEIKALLIVEGVDKSVDLSMFPFYLSYGYFPRNYTAFKGITQLQPGSWLLSRDNKIKIGRYWSVRKQLLSKSTRPISAEDGEELISLIENSVKRQSVADVPVGAFLSGGIDSAIVTSTFVRVTGLRPQTFTVSVDDAEMNESRLARLSATTIKTNNHEIMVSSNDLLNCWDTVFDHFDQPFADLSAVPTFLLSKYASEHVKVALSGDGGDEQWGGYGNYQRFIQLRNFRLGLTKLGLQKPFALLLRGMDPLINVLSVLAAERVRRYGLLLNVPNQALYKSLERLDWGLQENIYGERLVEGADWEEFTRIISEEEELDGVMAEDIETFMVDDVLRKVDMMSMASGLEVRVPLLDHRIIEKSIEISWISKVSSSGTKLMVRNLFKNRLPTEIINAPKKGFSLPADQWFRGPLRDMAQSILFDSSCKNRGIINPEALDEIWKSHQSGRLRRGKLIAAMMLLEQWLERVETPVN